MNVDAFIRERRDSWTELDALLRDAGGRPMRLGASRVRRLGEVYRAAAADLATARRRFPGDPLVGRLEDLVLRARASIYGSATRRGSARRFFADTYWQRVREQPWAVALAALLLFVPSGLGIAWAVNDAPAAAHIVPGSVERITERDSSADLDESAATSTALASEIMTNNIRVTFLAFAGGALLGLLTAFSLIFNGLMLGVVTGLAFNAGNGDIWVQLIVPHGALELSCIVVAGASGLRLAKAIIVPGRGRRGATVIVEARRSVELIIGTAPWLVLAGLTEGFVTPAGIGVAPALTLGLGLASIFWALVWWRGRPAPSDQGAALEAEVGGHAGRTERTRIGFDHRRAGGLQPAGHG